MMYSLPTVLSIGGNDYRIRSDFRAALDIFAALSDAELNDYEKAQITLDILYIDKIPIELKNEALVEAMQYLNLGEKVDEKQSIKNNNKIMDWEQDFNVIVGPINRILGYEIREKDNLHFYTFISAFYEIGECTFSNIVSIRNKKMKGKKLEKYEEEFYKDTKSMIDLKVKMTEEEEKFIEDIRNAWKANQ